MIVFVMQNSSLSNCRKCTTGNSCHKDKIDFFMEKYIQFSFYSMFPFVLFVRDEAGRPGYHESLYDALQSLRDKEFSAFHDSLKDAR